MHKYFNWTQNICDIPAIIEYNILKHAIYSRLYRCYYGNHKKIIQKKIIGSKECSRKLAKVEIQLNIEKLFLLKNKKIISAIS